MTQALNAKTIWAFIREASFTITPHPVKRRDWFVLAFILIVGAVPRFAYPEAIDWSKDHSDMAMMAQDIVDGKGIPLVGQPSSAVIPHSPFYIYILVPPYALTDDPVIVTMFITALDLVAIGLLWFLAFRYFGPAAALAAGLAYAANPWAIGFSRTIWSGDHRVPLLLLAVLLGFYGFLEGKRWAQILCLPILLIALQVHFAAWALLPVYLWLVWAGRARTTRRTLLISVILGILVILPFTIGTIQTLTSDTRLVTDFQGQDRELSIRNLAKPWGQVVWLATGLGSEQYAARETAAELMAEINLPVFLWVLLGAAVAAGLIGIWKYAPPPVGIFVLLWAFLPPLVFTIPIVDVYPHYFIPSIPVYSLLAGIGIRRMIEALNARLPAARAVVGALFAIIFLTQILFNNALTVYADTHFTAGQFGSGTPMHYMKNVAAELQQHEDIVVIASDDWLDFSRTGSWMWAPFLRDTAACLRDIRPGQNVAVFPDGPFAATFAPRVPAAPVLDALYRAGTPTDIPLRPGEGIYSIYNFAQAPAWNGPELTPVTPARFENGVTLTGYHLSSEQITLEWNLPEKSKTNYQYWIEALDADGQSLGRLEADFWPGINWCAGDRLLTWADAGISADLDTLRIGLQAAGADTPLNILDQSGQTAGSSVDIRP
ncbi:MAG: hypothetical protein HXY41_06675 [Chloroflexi bacterium]|nr:hypothetical protein [Chloroflexota bacterium]